MEIASILATSLDRWGEVRAERYLELIALGMETIASVPGPALARARPELGAGVRSLHLRHVRGSHGVKDPVHVIYYKVPASSEILILRVLHERMKAEIDLRPRAPRSK